MKCAAQIPGSCGRFLAGVFFFLLVLGRTQAQESPPCAPLDQSLRSRIIHVVARSAHMEPLLPAIEEEKLVPGTCYWHLSLSAPNSNHKLTLFLSPDRRFLSSNLIDLSVDQGSVDARLSSKLNQEAETDSVPILGGVAPVTVVIFADFQCPYCAVFAEMLERYQKANPSRIRIVFRNLPLPIHAWAASAARSSICVYEQSPSAFWKFHNLLFSEQRNITPETLPLAVSRFFATSPELHPDAYSKCLGSALPEQRLDRDLSSARSLEIRTTPTIFINGRKYGGFVNDAAFALAIDLATSAESTVSISPADRPTE